MATMALLLSRFSFKLADDVSLSQTAVYLSLSGRDMSSLQRANMIMMWRAAHCLATTF